MDRQTLKTSLASTMPPTGLAPALEALWWDARGDWDKAHLLVQDGTDAASFHVHAYLHRKEGDAANAGYWYRRAGAPPATDSLDAEWDALAEMLSR